MLLTEFNLAHYLFDRGYLSVESFVDGTFTVRSAASRNFNFIVNQEKEEAFFIKQVKAFEPERTNSLRTEATCYWLANHEPEFASLRTFLPRYYDYDYLNHILILEYVRDAVDLDAFYFTHQHFPPALLEEQARLLHAFHREVFSSAQDRDSRALFKKRPPMVFWLSDQHFETWKQDPNPAVRQMIGLVEQEPAYFSLIQKVKENWQPDSLIHGDIKHSNFLVREDALEAGAFDLRLVDWEIADIGDPCWDVAAVLQSYLFLWVLSETQKSHSGFGGRLANFALEDMQPAIRTFWDIYRHLMNFTEAEADRRLLKSMQFCALRLIQSCYESIQQAYYLPPHSAQLLQLSLNILQAPREAVQSLFDLKTAAYEGAL